MLGPLRKRIRIDVLDEGSVQEYPSDPGLGPAGADPADSRPGEGEGRLCAHRVGFRRAPLTVGFVPIVLNPTGAVGNGRVSLLYLRSRGSNLERIHDDKCR